MADQIPEKRSGLARVMKAFFYTKEGLVDTFRTEAAFRQELAAAVFMLPAALWFGEGGLEKAVMVAVVLLVLVVELLNSSLEAAINRFGPEWNAFSKKSKDAGSAAVFLALCNAGIVWVLCLFW